MPRCTGQASLDLLRSIKKHMDKPQSVGGAEAMQPRPMRSG